MSEKQRKFFESGATLAPAFRDEQLSKLSDLIARNEKKIADALFADLHKSFAESILSEISILQEEIHHCRKHLHAWMKPKRVRSPLAHWPAKSYILAEPKGVALIIGPWNYPFQLVLAPLIGAIAAGNAAVLKPSELAPHTAQVLAELIASEFPSEYISVELGGVAETQALLRQKWDHIFFTGGFSVGQVVMRAAAENLTPVTLELGGKSPCIVDSSANLQVAARRIAWGKFFNAGQTCVAPDYLYLEENIADEFLLKLTAEIERQLGKDASRSPDYSRIVNERHFARLEKLLAHGKIFYGGERKPQEKYFGPTILENITWDMPVMAEEIFGPVLPVLRFRNLDTAIAEIRKHPKPLALYFFSECQAHRQQVLRDISFGGGCINDCLIHLSNPELPFGGVGPSGMGMYHGRHSFETFSHSKSVTEKSSRFDVLFRYPPFTSSKLKLLRKLLS